MSTSETFRPGGAATAGTLSFSPPNMATSSRSRTCLVHAIDELGVVPVFRQDGPDDGPRDVLRFPLAG